MGRRGVGMSGWGGEGRRREGWGGMSRKKRERRGCGTEMQYCVAYVS